MNHHIRLLSELPAAHVTLESGVRVLWVSASQSVCRVIVSGQSRLVAECHVTQSTFVGLEQKNKVSDTIGR